MVYGWSGGSALTEGEPDADCWLRMPGRPKGSFAPPRRLLLHRQISKVLLQTLQEVL